MKDKEGKYPFGRVTEAGDFSALWIQLSGALDYDFTEEIYLRGSVLYGIRLANRFEDDVGMVSEDLSGAADTLLGNGLSVKVAVGYRF